MHSRLAMFNEASQAHAPQGSVPTSAEVVHCLRSCGSHTELADEIETAEAHSWHALPPRTEAHLRAAFLRAEPYA